MFVFYRISIYMTWNDSQNESFVLNMSHSESKETDLNYCESCMLHWLSLSHIYISESFLRWHESIEVRMIHIHDSKTCEKCTAFWWRNTYFIREHSFLMVTFSTVVMRSAASMAVLALFSVLKYIYLMLLLVKIESIYGDILEICVSVFCICWVGNHI